MIAVQALHMLAKFTTSIDDYLLKRLMPVEGAVPQLDGVEMYARRSLNML
ncbi:MAG: hypothetical protein ACRD19_08690 [Terriglobia bacterium]